MARGDRSQRISSKLRVFRVPGRSSCKELRKVRHVCCALRHVIRARAALVHPRRHSSRGARPWACGSTALARRRRGRGRPRQRGQSLVEFALVFPLFILLLAGMIDFGLGLYSYMTINNATRDAARLGATMCTANPCAAAVSARAVNAASGLGIETPVVACTNAQSNAAINCASGTAQAGRQRDGHDHLQLQDDLAARLRHRHPDDLQHEDAGRLMRSCASRRAPAR